jgi:hypothetical protein
MNTNSSKSSKLIASIPLVIYNKDSKIKIGKINDTLDTEKCLLTKEQQTKNYKLIEKKQKFEIKFTGSLLAEQSSKYFIFKFNEETKKIEGFPGDDWWTFKKDIQYNTMSLEEAEERLKAKSGFTDYIRNKGSVVKGSKKEKVFKEEKETGIKLTRLNDEDEEILDEVKTFVFEREQKSEEDREEDIDPELKDIPSDIEEVFMGKVKDKDEAFGEPAIDDEIDEEESESSDGFFGKKDEESDDVDVSEELSSIIEKDESMVDDEISQSKIKQNEYIGNKRRGEEMNNFSENLKKQKTASEMEDVLDNLFAKNKRMTYEKIVRELIRLNFKQEHVGISLPLILSRSYGKYSQGGENFYFKKSFGEK